VKSYLSIEVARWLLAIFVNMGRNPVEINPEEKKAGAESWRERQGENKREERAR
jgi:hypothetical protein